MRTIYIIGAALCLFLQAGCGNNGEQYLAKHKEIVSQSLQQSNQDLLFGELNQEEQQLYTIIIEDGKKAIADVSKQVANAYATIAKSEQLIDEEKERIGEASKQLDEAARSLLDKLKDTKENQRIKQLHNAYLNRAELYDKALNKYKELLENKSRMYGLLESEKKLKVISTSVDEVNALNEELETCIKEFNAATETYNEIERQL
ncbi:MAG: YkyA family protein [Bacillus sp. (in: firmicutes)]